MVIRNVDSAAAAASSRILFARALVAAALSFPAFASAQQPTPAPAPTQQEPKPATPPTPTPAAEPAKDAAAAVGTTYGRVVVDQAPLRCWSGAVAQPPVFDEVLTKDTVVMLGRSENGFRCVQLPLGPVGFVSKKFTESTPEGRVKTKGVKVAFRYRPKSSEAPVSQLENGTELNVVGEQEDWFRVRVAGIEAWLAEAEVQAADAADPAPAAAYAELKTKQEAEVKARLDLIAAQIAKQKQDEADLAAVQVVQDAFLAEQKKPLVEQKYAPLNESLDKLSASFGAESAGKPAIAALKKRIEAQSWIADATAVVREAKPQPTDVPPPDKKDPLERFQSIGWLRYERRIAGPGVYYLEKGGQRQYEVACSNNRYDLGLFVDCEVAVIGPRRRPRTSAMSVIDVERLEVLGAASKK
jgi:hypothetical protein